MKQKPSFQLYQQDFLGSLDVKTMKAEEVGCYCLLLFNCYNNGGELPDEIEELTILCHGIPPASKVLKKFYKDGEKLRHVRVDKELEKQEEYSKMQSEKANKRWGKGKKKNMPRHSHGRSSASFRQCSSTSTSNINNNTIIDRQQTPAEKMKTFIEAVETGGERFKELIEYIYERNQNMQKEKIESELKKFASYWTEKTPSGKKQLWQTKKTFEVHKRLATWFGNIRENKSDKPNMI